MKYYISSYNLQFRSWYITTLPIERFRDTRQNAAGGEEDGEVLDGVCQAVQGEERLPLLDHVQNHSGRAANEPSRSFTVAREDPY